jgi:gamma-glutamyl:cysteine ligase YbdK (ATP-grasp superfamily)
MGLHIDRDHFEEADFARFEARLRDCLEALEVVLARPGFGEGETTIGAELEMNLVDAHGHPAPINRQVLGATVDPRITLELDRFNLEVNTRPWRLAGAPFSAMAESLDDALAEVRRAAATHGARPVCIGILPTLTERDLGPGALTEACRYRALVAGIHRLRREPIPVRIEGHDVLDIQRAEVAFEGASTSFQVHLRVPPAEFAAAYNAAQVATAPALAAACNSPIFLGRRLWHETRVALFQQATDDRPGAEGWRAPRVSFGHGWARRGAFELFAESVAMHESLLPVVGPEDPLEVARAGGLPRLGELRLHHGTIWRWNRAVYDTNSGGHLRVELRALPSGPSVADMVANGAFALGLTLALAPHAEALVTGMTFAHAARNFYAAARRGLDAELLWPDAPGGRIRAVTAAELVPRLVPVAAEALRRHGVEAAEVDRWLGVIEARLGRRTSGATWLLRSFERMNTHALLERYVAASESGRPVHEWA